MFLSAARIHIQCDVPPRALAGAALRILARQCTTEGVFLLLGDGGAVDDVADDGVVLLLELLEDGDDVLGVDHLDVRVDALLRV